MFQREDETNEEFRIRRNEWDAYNAGIEYARERAREDRKQTIFGVCLFLVLCGLIYLAGEWLRR
jgi:hypothetical protein